MFERAVRPGERLELVGGQDGRCVMEAEVDTISKERMSGFYPKNKARLRINGGDDMLDVVIKKAPSFGSFTFGEEGRVMSPAMSYFHRWLYLKSIGIPVVPSMWVVDSYRVAMPDMTKNGGKFFDKEYLWGLLDLYNGGKSRELLEVEEKFLEIDERRIKAEISRIHKIAWDNCVLLPTDNEEWSVFVELNEGWQVLVLDLSHLGRQIFGRGETAKFLFQRKVLLDRFDQMRDLLVSLKMR